MDNLIFSSQNAFLRSSFSRGDVRSPDLLDQHVSRSSRASAIDVREHPQYLANSVYQHTNSTSTTCEGNNDTQIVSQSYHSATLVVIAAALFVNDQLEKVLPF